MRKTIIFISLLFILIILSGCTQSTSVILNTDNNGELGIYGFSRGQTYLGLQCTICPHISANVVVTNTSNEIICEGSNEIIVDSIENHYLKISCKGLEEYEDQEVIISVKGFVGGKIVEIVEYNFEESMEVNFESV